MGVCLECGEILFLGKKRQKEAVVFRCVDCREIDCFHQCRDIFYMTRVKTYYIELKCFKCNLSYTYP